MIGISLNYNKSISSEQSQYSNSLANQFIYKKINSDSYHTLSFTLYEGYPFYLYEDNSIVIFIEGKIYNKSNKEICRELIQITSGIFNSNSKDFEKIKKWIEVTDGDFIIYLYSKVNKKILVFNDFLGRLTSYYSLENNKLIFSRNIKYIFQTIKNKDFNKNGIAQFLLLGYGISDTTLFSNIKRFRPASIIYINSVEEKISISTISEIDYSVNHLIGNNYKQHVNYLADTFIEGCKNRVFDDKEIVVSLSGGLDSRLVTSGLYKSDFSFNTATLYDPWKFSQKSGSLEVDVAKEISNLVGANSEFFEGKLANGNDFKTLLELKNGANHLGVSYLLNYLTQVKNKFGSNILFFTGDGGKILKYNDPAGKIDSYNSLLNYIIKILKRLDLESVSKISGVKSSEIRDNIIEHLESYPEINFKDKYLHFIFGERDPNWLYDGEDRNRHFFWSVSPFFTLDFFNAVIQTPNKLKKIYKLYIDLLDNILPEINDILFANLQWPINSYKTKMYLHSKNIYNAFPIESRKKIKKIFKKETLVNSNDNKTFIFLKEVIDKNSEFYSNYLNIDAINSFNKFRPDELKMLLNLVLTMRYFYDDTSVLDNYNDIEFNFR